MNRKYQWNVLAMTLLFLMLQPKILGAQNIYYQTPPGYEQLIPIIAFQGKIICAARVTTADHNFSIFQTDPATKTSTLFYSDTALGGIQLRNFLLVGSKIYFTSRLGLHEIDISVNSIRRVAKFAGASTGVYTFNFNKKVFCTAGDSRSYVYDPVLEKVDTLKFNTVAVNPGIYPQVIVQDNFLYFLGQGTGPQLSLQYVYRYDGVNNDLLRSNNIAATSYLSISGIAFSSGTSLFTPISLNGVILFYIVEVNPTPVKYLTAFNLSNFNNITKINLQSLDNSFNHVSLLNNTVYYKQYGKIWKTDGLTSATVASDVLMDGFNYTVNNAFAVINGKLLGIGEDVNGRELWVSDGTTNGTHLLYNLFNGTYINALGDEIPLSGNPMSPVVYQDCLYFLAENPGNINDHFGEYYSSNFVWRSNGTSEGTFKYSSIECSEMMTNRSFSETNLSAVVIGKLDLDAGLFTLKPIMFSGSTGLWESASSWTDNLVPTQKDDVVVNGGLVNVTSNVIIRSLSTTSSAEIYVQSGASITITQ